MEEYISRVYWRGRSGRGWLGLTGHGGAGEDGSHAVEQIRSRGSRDLGRGDVGQEGSIGRTVARRRSEIGMDDKKKERVLMEAGRVRESGE